MLLSICIPNYNRLERLKNLLQEVIQQINKDDLSMQIEICISDDGSDEDPSNIVDEIHENHSEIKMIYERHMPNRGMDYNFLKSVQIASGDYCWIIGNDDVPETDGIKTAIDLLKKHENADLIVTDFDCYDYMERFCLTREPLLVKPDVVFIADTEEGLKNWIHSIRDNTGVFGFLSNTIFKRQKWIDHGKMFESKMGSIFIQVYMNLQTMINGGVYYYSNCKIIRNHIDEADINRMFQIAIGLYDAVDYFFTGDDRWLLMRRIVDEYINGYLYEFDATDTRYREVMRISTPKAELYKSIYIRNDQLESALRDKTIIIYGAGNMGEKLLRKLMTMGMDIVGFCDRDPRKQISGVLQHTVFGIEKLLDYCQKDSNTIVLLANSVHLVEIHKKLTEHATFRIAIAENWDELL